MRLSKLPAFLFVLIVLTLVSSCSSPSIDVAATIKVTNLTTGWFDAGIVNGMNKLVPSASFTVVNTGTTALSGLQVFSVFRFNGETQELGSSLIILHGQDALAPQGTSKALTVRGNWGFSGQQPRNQMLVNKYFKDAHIEVFAKYAAGQFVKLIDVPVKRQLLTH
jgi:hypothetical protein